MDDKDELLLLDQDASPIIIEEECQNAKPIIKDFMEYYVKNKDKPVEEWLSQKMQEQLPDRKPEEIQAMTNEIITTIEVDEANKISLAKAIENGRSKESWFASETQKATSAMSAQEAATYLTGLDNALQTANESLYRTITTQAGAVSQNPRLDGFIAEQYHAQTFNLNAEATGSRYRAKVLEPNGNGYAKNSVDIVIVDGNGKVVKRYQSKYCKDAKATEQAFEYGDYRGQQKLVAEGQQADIQKKSTTVIEAPDGTTSNPLSKSTAEQMRDEAQGGKWNELNWNEYKTKDLAIGIGKQAGYAALQGAAIGVGFDVAQKLWNGEDIKGEEVIETALVSGADFGVKAAAAGAIKVGIEKEIITVIPKGTPAGTIANIAFVAIEDAKVIGKMAAGELTFKEGIEKIEQTTVATAAGLVTMGEGATIGATVGAVFGPVGAAVGGFVGGTVGYMAGSKVGETVVKGAQKLREGAVKVAKTVVSEVKNVCSTVASGVSNFCGGFASFFGF
ncbi:hypothetical protein [Anaerotignum sp.]|uniref:hypothetical protein n=1 Tax=Anaerotignum sp. TaxID=2039241 RepID=UPI0028982A40|nr:hypothetical protein [Anaerotignum sp.]